MKIPQLTFTRFLAALCIVIFHLGQEAYPFSNPGFIRWLHAMSLLVGYFFTLSGFILVVSQARPAADGSYTLPATVAPGRFYLNRFARIYPLYLLALLLWAAFNLLARSVTYKVTGLDFTLNLTLLQSWVPGHAITANFPGWSLSVEALFYAAFPLLYPWLRAMRLWTAAAWGIAVLALCCGFGILSDASILLDEYYAYLPPAHLGSFVAGIVGGLVFVQHRSWLMGHRVAVRILGALAAIWLVSYVPRFHDYAVLAHFGGAAPFYLLIIYALSLSIRPMPLLARGPLPWLGEISYGLYILHIPISIIAYGILHKLDITNNTPLFYSTLAILIASSALAYRYIEVPARDALRSKR